MAKYQARMEIKYDLEIEVNAADDVEAITAIQNVITNHISNIEGTYSGGDKVTVLGVGQDMRALFNKSAKEDRDQKEQNLNSYVAQLDDEEKELLRELIASR